MSNTVDSNNSIKVSVQANCENQQKLVTAPTVQDVTLDSNHEDQDVTMDSTVLGQKSIEWPDVQSSESGSSGSESEEVSVSVSISVKRKRSDDISQGPTNKEAKNRKLTASSKNSNKACNCDTEALKDKIIAEQIEKIELARSLNQKLCQTKTIIHLVTDILGLCTSSISEVSDIAVKETKFATSMARCHMDVEAAKVHFNFVNNTNQLEASNKTSNILMEAFGKIIDKCQSGLQSVNSTGKPESNIDAIKQYYDDFSEARSSQQTSTVTQEVEFPKTKKVRFQASTPRKSSSKINLSPSSSTLEEFIEIPIESNAKIEEFVFKNQDLATAHMNANLNNFKHFSKANATCDIDFSQFNVSQESADKNISCDPFQKLTDFQDLPKNYKPVLQTQEPLQASLQVSTSQNDMDSENKKC